MNEYFNIDNYSIESFEIYDYPKSREKSAYSLVDRLNNYLHSARSTTKVPPFHYIENFSLLDEVLLTIAIVASILIC